MTASSPVPGSASPLQLAGLDQFLSAPPPASHVRRVAAAGEVGPARASDVKATRRHPRPGRDLDHVVKRFIYPSSVGDPTPFGDQRVRMSISRVSNASKLIR